MSGSLRSEQFEALLQRLGPDREFAGAQYEKLRRRLVTVFEYRHCAHPDDLADQTLDRAARKLQELGSEFVGSDPARFVFGVAWNVARESFRRPSSLPLPERWEPVSPVPSEADDERDKVCLDRCLEDLAAPDRDLLLDYHQGEKSARIQRRAELARERRLSPNALRLKIHRLTGSLRECIVHCTNREVGAGVDVHA